MRQFCIVFGTTLRPAFFMCIVSSLQKHDLTEFSESGMSCIMDLSQMTVVQLKAKLKKNGVKVSCLCFSFLDLSLAQ